MRGNWEEVLLQPWSTLTQAATILTRSSMRIVLVVDENGLLLGTVTDGDIRRALIQGSSMDVEIQEIMETNPVTISLEHDRQSVIALMRKTDLLQLPILDLQGKVVGLEVLQDLFHHIKRNNPVVLMVGGFGNRLYPLTRELPKPLLRVGRKPLLESTVEQLAEAGFTRLFMAVHFKSDLVKKYFGDGSDWGVTINYLEEIEPLGTAGALGLLEPGSIKSPILVMNGDLLTRLDFGQLLDFHQAQHAHATMCVREYDFQIPYGVVTGDGVRVESIIEKPTRRCFVNAGIYVLNPELILNKEYRQQYRDMPDLLSEVIDAGNTVNMFPIHEYWLDIGRIEEYEQAQVDVIDLNL